MLFPHLKSGIAFYSNLNSNSLTMPCLQSPAWPGLDPGPNPTWTRSVQNTCLLCYLKGFNSMCSQPRKMLGSTSRKIVLVSNPINPDSKLKSPLAQHHLRDLLAQLFLLQLLFFHLNHTFDKALYPIIQPQTTALSASEIQPLPL